MPTSSQKHNLTISMITTMPQSQKSSSDANSHKSGRNPVVSQLGTSAHSQTFIYTQNTWYTYIHVMHNSYVYTQCVARTKPEFMRPKLLYLFLYHKLHCKIAILVSVKILYLFMTKSSHFENMYTNSRVRSTHLLQFLWKCCLLCPSQWFKAPVANICNRDLVPQNHFTEQTTPSLQCVAHC